MSTTRIAGMLRVLSLFLLIALTTHAQAATYSFKSLDVPGALSTEAVISINASGQVAGIYYDASSDAAPHGFVYSEGKYTSLDPPGATYTFPLSINASGQVAGYYHDASSTYGFVYSEGKYTSLDVPGARYTYAYSINDSGQVAGAYEDASYAYHGFVYSEGKYTSFDVPGATYIAATSINASGQVAGYYEDAERNHGFVYSEGKCTSLDPPGSFNIESFVSINDSGQVAGSYEDASNYHGFVYSEGKYTSFDVPGATSTYAFSINVSGQVAGGYSDGSGHHGFIATPMTPFSAFNVTRLVIDQNRGALFLWSNFTLGKDSNGIHPVSEEVMLRIANATLTIPAGSFHQNSHPSLFAFAGQIDNVWIEALIKPVGRNRFAFQALAYGASIGDTKNPVTVELTIGDDSGTTTAKARTH